MKKETLRGYIAIVLSVIAILTSLTAISMGLSVIFSDTSVGNDVLPGGELFAFAFVYLTEMLASIFAASASALAAFFTFFVQKQMKNGKKTAKNRAKIGENFRGKSRRAPDGKSGGKGSGKACFDESGKTRVREKARGGSARNGM